MKILLFGKNGQLGREAQRTLAVLGEVIPLDYPEVDFTQPQDVKTMIGEIKPDVIINAAAYTAVDRAESEPQVARLINAITPGVIAETARAMRAVFIHYSTDYVFDGKKGSPYVEQDAPHPLNLYGQTKIEGEQAVAQNSAATLIFRTSWVYSTQGNGFLAKALHWARTQKTMRVVEDQVGSPTWARLLAEMTASVIAAASRSMSYPSVDEQAFFEWVAVRSGLYHLGGDGYVSRLEWVKSILEDDPKRSEHIVTEIVPAKTV